MDKGQLLSEHPPDRSKLKFLSSFLGTFIALPIVFLLLNVMDIQSLLLLEGIMLMITVLVLVSFVQELWNYPTVMIYENGLLSRTRGKKQFWKWSEIDDVRILGFNNRNRKRTTGSVEYELYIQSKQVLRINDHSRDFPGLIDKVLIALYKQKNYHDLYARGQTITAGTMQVNQQGVTLNTEIVIPWSNLMLIRLENFHNDLWFDVYQGKSAKVSIHDIPNAFLLVMLISEQINAGRMARATPDTKATEALFHEPTINIRSHPNLKALAWRLLSAGLIFALFMMTASSFWEEYFNPTDDYSPGINYLLLNGAFLVVILWFLLIYLRILWRWDRLKLDNVGFHHRWRVGETHHHWGEITQTRILRKWWSPWTSEFALWIGDKRVLTIGSHYENWEQLGNAAFEAVGYSQYPQFKKQMEDGETLSFGIVQINNHELRLGQNTLTWDQIATFNVIPRNMQYYLTFYDHQNKPIGEAPALKIPNLFGLSLLLKDKTQS